MGLDIGLNPLVRVGPNGGERERFDTDGTRVGRVCGGKEGEGGIEGGRCVLCSVTLDTFDLTLICPIPTPLTTDDEPEWFSSLEELGVSFGGEYILRGGPKLYVDDVWEETLPFRDRAEMSEEAVNARWRSSGKEGAEVAVVTFVRAEAISLAFT